MKIENIVKIYNGIKIIDRLTIDFPDNSFTAITGISGCGKTTLLRIIAGLDKNYTGTVNLDERKIVFLFQESRLMPWFTAKQNIESVCGDTNIIEKLFCEAKIENCMDKLPSQLSGGQCRRVTLLMALSYGMNFTDAVYLLDEPFNGIDQETKDSIYSMLKEYLTNRTVLAVTHDTNEINVLADYVMKIRSSPIQQENISFEISTKLSP